uniref:NADH dehydrogenase I subunit N n=1 Tax=uncultured prokaryote TaxID=198431 RepID=H5SPB7_9ZZZZ|nr:NADH dehydrogenase I subunit N [uncultured prokaryote]
MNLLTDTNLFSIAPEIVVILSGFILMLLDPFFPYGKKRYISYLALIGCCIAIIFTIMLHGKRIVSFNNMIVLDGYSVFFDYLFLLIAILSILIACDYIEEERIMYGEYFSLILFATSGMMLMAKGVNLLVIFLGLEILSLSTYILAGIMKRDLKSNEAALKYFLLGAFSSAFLLYGITLIYGASGSIDIFGIWEYMRTDSPSVVFLAGVALLIVGFGFKVAAVPFHMWTPDAYEGAPTSVTAFMSVGPKAAGFAAFMRVFLSALLPIVSDWSRILWIIAVLTMFVGNVAALVQENIKRMLAYSSIAHAGYIIIGIIVADELGSSALLFYLLSYTLMNVGVFTVAILMRREGEGYDIRDYAGASVKHPLLSLIMTVFLLSLAGFPPTAGFMAKFYIFSAAVKKGYIDLALIGVINSAISVYYYLRVVVFMYMLEPTREFRPLRVGIFTSIALIISLWGTIQLGIYPSGIIDFARSVAGSLFHLPVNIGSLFSIKAL